MRPLYPQRGDRRIPSPVWRWLHGRTGASTKIENLHTNLTFFAQQALHRSDMRVA